MYFMSLFLYFYYIHLQEVEALILEELEARVPAAEVIHPDLVARRAEAVEHLADLLVAVGQDILDNLKVQQIARHIVLAHGVLDNLKDVAVDEVETREVQRNRHRRQPRLPDASLIAADLLDEEGVELMDEIVLFENADEKGGVRKPQFGSSQRARPSIAQSCPVIVRTIGW